MPTTTTTTRSSNYHHHQQRQASAGAGAQLVVVLVLVLDLMMVVAEISGTCYIPATWYAAEYLIAMYCMLAFPRTTPGFC